MNVQSNGCAEWKDKSLLCPAQHLINLVGLLVHTLAVDELKNRLEKHLWEPQTVKLTKQQFLITYTKRLNYRTDMEFKDESFSHQKTVN